MPAAPKSMVGVVVSAGKMQRAVKVRVAGQAYNSFLKKVPINLPVLKPCLKTLSCN